MTELSKFRIVVFLLTSLLSLTPIYAGDLQPASTRLPLSDLQSALEREISQAKIRGVGTKPYEDALAAIKSDAQTGHDPEKIRLRCESLLKNLHNQNHEAELLKRGVYRRVLTSTELNWGEFAPVMHAIQRKIKSNWHPAQWDESKKLVVQFEATRSGQIRNLEISKSSGNAEADQAALDAVRNSVPLPPIPSNIKLEDETVCIEFSFDYNVFHHGSD